MEEKNEQAVNAEISEGQVEEISAKNSIDKNQASFGKFKDLDSLLSAYNSLEAEFTKRSQRLKELEGNIEKNDIKEENNKEENEKKIIENYLKNLITSKPQAVIIDRGNSVLNPNKKPKTIAEAGKLVQDIFTK